MDHITDKQHDEIARKRISAATETVLSWDGQHGHWFWISYADPDLPEGHRFLGVVILKAPTLDTAPIVSHALNLSPGGAALFAEIEGDEMLRVIHPEYTYRLLNVEEVHTLQSKLERVLSPVTIQ